MENNFVQAIIQEPSDHLHTYEGKLMILGVAHDQDERGYVTVGHLVGSATGEEIAGTFSQLVETISKQWLSAGVPPERIEAILCDAVDLGVHNALTRGA